MSDPRPRLILFPGLGIGGGLFERQKSIPARLEFPIMPTARQEESVRDYALRVADDIDPTGPLYLAGVSFGAMVALEAAAKLGAAGVIMIAGCTTPEQISPTIRLLAFLASGIPAPLFPVARLVAPAFLRLLGRFDRNERAMLVSVFADANFHLARWGARQIMQWTAPTAIGCPVHWIHGSMDHIVPADRVRPDLLIAGAGHFLNVSHPQAANDFITSRLHPT